MKIQETKKNGNNKYLGYLECEGEQWSRGGEEAGKGEVREDDGKIEDEGGEKAKQEEEGVGAASSHFWTRFSSPASNPALVTRGDILLR